MRIARTTVASVVAAPVVSVALAVALAGCGSKPTPPAPKSGSTSSATSSPSSASASSPAARSGDYAALLINATDIDAPVPFTASPPTNNPNGQPGVAATFKDEDGSHVIKDTIQVFADPAAATDALNSAKGQQDNAVKDPTTQPLKVGTGGTLLLGNSPDHSKGVTILLFTQGRAFVTIQFDGPPETLAPPDFVNDVGQKQDAAVKKGLGG